MGNIMFGAASASFNYALLSHLFGMEVVSFGVLVFSGVAFVILSFIFKD